MVKGSDNVAEPQDWRKTARERIRKGERGGKR